MKLAFPTGWKPSFSASPGGVAGGAADERRQTILLGLGYTAFFILCFVLAAYYTFPYERLRDIITQRLTTDSADGSGPKTTVHIDELSPHWLTGIALEGVKVERTEPGASEPTLIEVDEVTLNVAPIALMLGTVEVSYSAEAGDGSIEGTYESDKEGKARHVVAELDALDLGKLGAGSFLGVPLSGIATGTVDIDLPEVATASAGLIDLKIEQLALGDGKNKVKIPGMAGGLTLDKLDAGTLELKIALKEGVAAIEKLEAKGKDLELDGSGSVELAYPLSRSRAAVTLGFKVSDGYKNRSDRTKMAFELLSGNPVMKRATGSDGMTRLQLSGVLTALRPRPAAPTAAASSSKRKVSAAAKSKRKGTPTGEEEAPAEPAEEPQEP